jgi:hypothetical protein
LRIERDAVLARQVIERALRNHRQRAAMVQRSLGRRVDAPVTAGDHQDAALPAGVVRGLLAGSDQHR